MEKKKFIFIVVIILLSMENVSIGSYWIRSEHLIKNPWKSKEYPYIIELNLSEDPNVGFRNINEDVIKYVKLDKVEYKNSFKSFTDSSFIIDVIDDENLFFYLGGDTIEYIRLHIVELKNHEVNRSFDKILFNNYWKMEGMDVLFTKENPYPNSKDAYQILCYGNNKFIAGGTFFVDVFKGNIFLHYIIDGTFEKRVYLIRSFSKDEIFYSVLSDQIKILKMTKNVSFKRK